jgi:hypothetical protein
MRKLFTLLILMTLIVTTASAQYNLLFNQPYYDGGSASTSAIDDVAGIDYQTADNFEGLTDPVEEFVFYGLALKYDGAAWAEQTPAATEPFFIRFYNYETAISEGLIATVTGTHQIELIDDYGDGWNGGVVSVFVNGVEVLSDLSLEDGPGPEYYDFEVTVGDEISTVYTAGSFPAENYYAILDPDGNIIAEDGGTMADPGASAPTGIAPGGPVALEPVWNSPLSSQSVTATVENVGTIWTGTYQLYKFTVTLNTPVNLGTGWISAQIDANNGSGTWFLWLNSQVGDGQSWQFDGSPASRSPFSNIDLAKISNGSTREQHIYDMAFELYGGVLSTPPVCATNPFPAISATDVATDVSLSWTGDPIATGYRIYMGTDNPPTNIANGIDLGLVTSYTPAIALDYETQYFWRVVPYNTIGSATDCDRWAFTTRAAASAGATCENPYIVTLPLVAFNGNTLIMDDDYSSTWITPNSNYMNGNDMVFEFNVSEAGYLSGSMTSPDTWIGLFILDDCPNLAVPAAVLKSATSSGSTVSFTDLVLQPGSYFAIVSSYPDPQTIEFTLNLSFVPLPACATPILPNATNITAGSALLGWTEIGAATLWDIEWGVSGFTQGTGTIVSGVTNPYTLTGLLPGTAYSYYVRASCGGGSFSGWSVVNSFTTQSVVPAPYVQGFATTTTPAGWNTTGWIIGSTRGVTGNPGYNIYKNLYTATPGTFSMVNVGPVSTGMLLTFDYKLANYSSPYNPPAAGSGDYTVSVSSDYGVNYTVLETVVNNAIAGWQSKEYDLSAYNGQVVKVRIVGTRLSGDFDLAFDNFRIGLPITCFAPTGVLVTDITQTTATISWTAPATAPSSGYQWEVRDIANAVISSGTTAAGITTASVTDLSASTAYSAFVRSNCGASYSDWSAPFTFSTACASIGLPWTENFDALTIPALPPCWLKENGDWATTNNANSTYDADAHSGTQFLRESYSATNEYIWTPGFALTAGQAYDFSFWWAGDGYDEWDGDVFVNGAQSSVGATQLGAPFVDFATITTKTYAQVTRTFTPATSGIYYFAIRVNATFNPWYLSFDDFSLMESAATKTLNLTGIMLEGLYDGSGTMRQAFNETGPQFGAGIADEITVELHAAADYGTTVHTVNNVMLSTSGMATIDDLPGTFDGDYYITIRHRNSIETTSATAVSFAGSIINQSYAAPADVYGANLVQMIDGYYAIYGGDVNQDGQVEGLDAGDIENGVNLFLRGYLTIDVDGSGGLDTNDFTIWENNNNNFVKRIIPVP